MVTVIMILAAVHGLAAVCFLVLTRSSVMQVDERGRRIAEAERREVGELSYRIAPLAPEA